MGCKAGRCNKTSTPQGIVTPSLEGWPTKAKEAPSAHEVRLTLLDTNPVFLMSQGDISQYETFQYLEETMSLEFHWEFLYVMYFLDR